MCPFYFAQVEKPKYALFLYPRASTIWFISPCSYKLNIMGFPNFSIWWETLWDYFQNKPNCTCTLKSISFTLWNIWEACNKGVFEFVPLNPFFTSSRISLSRLELQQYNIFATLPSCTFRCLLRHPGLVTSFSQDLKI